MALRALSDDEQLRVNAQVAAHPCLEPRGARSGAAQAARNARIILKSEFPGIPFRVRTQDRTSLYVSWPSLSGAPDWPAVKARLGGFVAGHYDGQSENYEYDDNVEHQAFRLAFGSVQYLSANPHPPSAEETALWLGRQMPTAAARRSPPRRRL